MLYLIRKALSKGDTACTKLPNGNYTNIDIHAQILGEAADTSTADAAFMASQLKGTVSDETYALLTKGA
jgi:hypothetical protein